MVFTDIFIRRPVLALVINLLIIIAGLQAIRTLNILMTTGATISGHFPLTLVSGPGAAARNSIGLVIVGGMAIGAFFTLFVIPSIYMLVARDHGKPQ